MLTVLITACSVGTSEYYYFHLVTEPGVVVLERGNPALNGYSGVEIPRKYEVKNNNVALELSIPANESGTVIDVSASIDGDGTFEMLPGDKCILPIKLSARQIRLVHTCGASRRNGVSVTAQIGGAGGDVRKVDLLFDVVRGGTYVSVDAL